MVTPKRSETVSPQITCSECLKEIPLSAALTPDGEDYIGHFCGIECYQKFVAQTKLNKSEKPKK